MNQMNEETARRLRIASAFTATARNIATNDARFFRVRRKKIADLDPRQLSQIHLQMEAENAENASSGWPAKTAELLSDESLAKDLLYLAATSSDEIRMSEATDWFSARGMSREEASLAAEAFIGRDRDLPALFSELEKASTECSLPPDFRRFLIACAKATDRVALSGAGHGRDIDFASFDRACVEAEAAILQAGENGYDIIPASDATRILDLLRDAGEEDLFETQVSVRSLDGHMRRAATKLWYGSGHVPSEGRYLSHVSSLASFALRQAELCDSPFGQRLGRLLQLEFCHAGRLAASARECSGPVLRAEELEAKRLLHSIAEICKEIESRGGCPGIVASSAGGIENEHAMLTAASRMMAWQSDLDTVSAGASYEDGKPVVGSERIERESNRAYGQLFDEKPDEFGATGGTEKRGSATVHTGRRHNFGALFDD